MGEEEDYGAKITATSLAIMHAISLDGDLENFLVDRDVALEALASVAGLILAPMSMDWQDEIGPWFVGLVRESLDAAVLHFAQNPSEVIVTTGVH